MSYRDDDYDRGRGSYHDDRGPPRGRDAGDGGPRDPPTVSMLLQCKLKRPRGQPMLQRSPAERQELLEWPSHRCRLSLLRSRLLSGPPSLVPLAMASPAGVLPSHPQPERQCHVSALRKETSNSCHPLAAFRSSCDGQSTTCHCCCLVGLTVACTAPYCRVDDIRYAAEKYGRVKDVSWGPSEGRSPLYRQTGCPAMQWAFFKPGYEEGGSPRPCGVLWHAPRSGLPSNPLLQVYVPKDYFSGRPRGIAFIEVRGPPAVAYLQASGWHRRPCPRSPDWMHSAGHA